jgi:hypothetical protein
MADEVQDPVVTTPAEVPAGGGSSAIPDPRFERLAQLETFYAQAQPLLDRLRPLEEDLTPLLEDEGYRDFQRQSRKSYYQMLEEQKKAEAEALSPAERRLLDEMDKRLKPALEEVDVLRKERESRGAREQEAAKKASEEFTRTNLEYAQRLVAEQKLSPEEVGDLGRFAKILHDETVTRGEPRFVPLEEAYKRLYGRAEAKATPAVPRSLRAKSAAPGIPGASQPVEKPRPDMKKPGSFTNYMMEKLNQSRKTG